MTRIHQIVFLAGTAMSFLSFGCTTGSQTVNSEQENLGRGIVVGSMAEQDKQQAIFASWPNSLTLKGQVKKIEGAAYILTLLDGTELRLPIDQHTTIDRPAHIGDWLEAYTDDSGRALQIRNIDKEIVLEDN